MQKSYTKAARKVSNLRVGDEPFVFHLQVVKIVRSRLSDIFKIIPLNDVALVSTFPKPPGEERRFEWHLRPASYTEVRRCKNEMR